MLLANSYKLIWFIRAIFYKFFFGHLGIGSYVGKPIFMTGINNAYLGKNFRVFPHARIEVLNSGKLHIGDNVSIGQSFHIICSQSVSIGDGALLSANVFITDTNHTFNDWGKPVHHQENECFSTRIGRNCFIGYGAVIQAGTILGDNCVVGANSTVKGVFPDGSVIAGSPARIIKEREHS